MERPIAPMLTAKFPSVLVGPNSAVVVDSSVTQRVDWEGELAVVIGRPLKNVSPSDALEGVFGYTVANDVTARDIMFADSQLIRGKNLDTFCPIPRCGHGRDASGPSSPGAAHLGQWWVDAGFVDVGDDFFRSGTHRVLLPAFHP